MEERLEANRANWDERVPIHFASKFYDVEGWLARGEGPPRRELDALGDVKGLSLVQLQCHFGMETLCWARAGALVTGIDFSLVAIETAQRLAMRAGLGERATFVCANVFDAPEALQHERFDVVYVSLGSLGWLPDIAAWGQVVAALLARGGRLYLHDTHPFESCFDDVGDRVVFGYFEEPNGPYVDDEDETYTDGERLTTTRTYGWNHSLGEVVASLRNGGLVIDSLEEHDWTLYQRFSWLVPDDHGHFLIPKGRPRVPLSFTLLAHAAR